MVLKLFLETEVQMNASQQQACSDKLEEKQNILRC